MGARIPWCGYESEIKPLNKCPNDCNNYIEEKEVYAIVKDHVKEKNRDHKMSTRDILEEIKSRIASYETDLEIRKIFYEAIDTAADGMENYERLLNQMLTENRAQLVARQHEIDTQIQRYEMFKNFGGNIP
jgi:predicted small metal-binding protein